MCSPWVDLTFSSPSWRSNEAFDYLPALQRQTGRKPPPCEAWPANPPRRHLYIADELVAHPLATLIMARDWKGAPPVYICTGWELMEDEHKFLARMLRLQGVPVVFEEYEAMPHCFAMALAQTRHARRCLDGWAEFIRTAVEKGPEAVESKALLIKAQTLEEMEREFSSLGEETEDEARTRVLARMDEEFPSGPPEVLAAKL